MEGGWWQCSEPCRLQTACREKLMNTAALQCGPIRGEHSCHVTGSPPMRGQQWLCKQSGHMQPQPGASTQVFAVRFLHHHPVPSQAWSHSAHWGLPAIYSYEYYAHTGQGGPVLPDLSLTPTFPFRIRIFFCGFRQIINV